MQWEAIYERLTSAGYTEFVEESENKPYLAHCLNSLECRGPTFLRFFGKGLEVKLIAHCGCCNMARDLSVVASTP